MVVVLCIVTFSVIHTVAMHALVGPRVVVLSRFYQYDTGIVFYMFFFK